MTPQLLISLTSLIVFNFLAVKTHPFGMEFDSYVSTFIRDYFYLFLQ